MAQNRRLEMAAMCSGVLLLTQLTQNSPASNVLNSSIEASNASSARRAGTQLEATAKWSDVKPEALLTSTYLPGEEGESGSHWVYPALLGIPRTYLMPLRCWASGVRFSRSACTHAAWPLMQA